MSVELRAKVTEEHVTLYTCEWIYRLDVELPLAFVDVSISLDRQRVGATRSPLPSPSNQAVGLRIRIRSATRSRPTSVPLDVADQPGLFSWSTSVERSLSEVTSWALVCWSRVHEDHCTQLDIIAEVRCDECDGVGCRQCGMIPWEEERR